MKCIKIEDALLENGQLKLIQVAERFNLSKTTISRIIHENLGMSKVSARWVPRMLMPYQKSDRVECSKQFLKLSGANQE
jgi:histone-lysine N-methyltransferase SETMAR